MIRIFCKVIGCLCLLSGLAPLFYGIFNIGCAVLIGAGVLFFCFHAIWKKLHPFKWLQNILRAGIILGLTACGVISGMMIYRGWFTPPPADAEQVTVIVLGAKVNGTYPSLMLRRRLDKAVNYLGENPNATCIVTGGQGPDEDYPEAYVMALYLENKGIDSRRIFQEDRSTNTRENLRYAADFLEDGQDIVIATDGFHQLRSYINAKKELEGKHPGNFYALPSLTPWGLMPMYWVRDLCGVPLAWLQMKFS